MGYTIIYDRAFLRTTRGIIPMILHGSNNCSDFVNGREVAEKYWSGWNDKLIEFSENNLHDTLASIFTSSFGDADYELFKWHGKWIRGNELEKWFKAGIKTAMTLEEIIDENPLVKITLKVMQSKPNEFDSSISYQSDITTTSELEKALDIARKKVNEIKENGGSAYLHLYFTGRDKLRKKQHQKPICEPCLVKCKHGYFVSQNEHSFKFVYDPKNGAKVFANEAEAQNMLDFRTWRIPYKIVKASTVFAERPYALLITTGNYARLYIQKRTSRKIYFTSSFNSSWRFSTKKEAEKCKQKIYDAFGGADRVGHLEVVSEQNIERMNENGSKNDECRAC